MDSLHTWIYEKPFLASPEWERVKKQCLSTLLPCALLSLIQLLPLVSMPLFLPLA